MCGINGIINFKDINSEEKIHRMNSLLVHRGPDGLGSFKFQNLLLGHTRLSIQDLSDKGSQPMSNDGNLWIVFNGEIYNFKEIRNELTLIGHKFYSNTDTEVILNSYKEWGIDSFKKFNGMWAFAIFDKSKQELIICRDRYGVKPCYYYQLNNEFIFSSEIKPILSVTNDDLDPNKILLNEHIKEGIFITDFKNIKIVEPGHYYKISLNNELILKKRWWNGLQNLSKISPNRAEIIDEFKDKLKSSINLRLISDVKVATSLSGGVDSSIIFSELNEINNQNVELNPFIVKYPENLTFDLALTLANKYDKKPYIIESQNKFSIDTIIDTFRNLEKKQFYNKQLDLYQNQKLNGFKVSIDGHGADESLGGYVDNLKDFAISSQNSLVNSYISINNISTSNLSEIIKKNFLSPTNQFINVDLTQRFKNSINSKYLEIKETFNPSKSFDDDLKELKNFDFSFQSLYVKSTYGFLQWLLNKWDKASMRHSIEIRSPFLDYNLFQYALSIPSNQKVLNGQNKSILREAYLNNIPNEILNFKNKQGLPSNKNLDYEDLIISNSINEKGFLESSLWDGNKIKKDIDLNNSNNKAEIIKIAESYLFQKSMTNFSFEKNKKASIAYNQLNN